MILTIRMIAESGTAAETEYIAHRMLEKAADSFERYLITDIQPYWKIEGCYEASLSAQCKKELNDEEVELLIQRITDKISWSSYGVDGVADSRLEILGSTFEHPAVRFCWFLFRKGEEA
ncbi:hypothetical protein [Saccharibacillus endophyticus]|uniref:DUF3168 domain-containing protein n=1 Tax=Saccharibacillus endophyticus TaxID=2060666 RepID=A0ABQ1ZZG0_9BACL|nr:hypothetical protein [Saccharibacillus endophyticus]GGH82532.1 hypothetical protein GCM10007362_33990 [Saccharibacillus endophyticus]